MNVSPNPVLAASLAGVPGGAAIRAVLPAGHAASLRPYMPVAKIVTPRAMHAYVWEAFGPDGPICAWVEREVHPADVEALGHDQHVYELRRAEHALRLRAYVVTRRDVERAARTAQREADENSTACAHRRYLGIPFGSFVEPPREDRDCIFDARTLLDLPPPGWPLTGTGRECHRNLMLRYEETPTRIWAGTQWAILQAEVRDELHAQRILDNEARTGKSE